MYLVSELLREKGSIVHTIAPDATVLDAARLMNQHRIGSLVVVEGDAQRGRIAGIFTERDILTRIVAEERAPSRTPVRDVMTTRVLTCAPQTSLDELRNVMRQKRIRHIPVLDRDTLAGIVSIGDVNAAEEKTLVETISYLEAYITR